MEAQELTHLASRLMACPTAPFHEGGVRAVVETICAEHGLSTQRDTFGNVIVRLGSRRQGRPIAFAAHLDHPGFAITKRLGPGRWEVQFNGGVPDRYFRPGIPLELHPGHIPAKLGSRRHRTEQRFEVRSPQRADAAPEFGVWDLPEFSIRRGQIHGRACDDLIGVTAALGALIDLQRRKVGVHALALISRAEEVGFQGALTLAESGLIPKDTLLVSLETSREMPPVKMGEGVIVRVGDRSSIFGSNATRYLTEIASELAAAKPSLAYQRALMSGGTCEATAYQEYGYETGAVCIALGHYHNCAPKDKIAAEFVSIDDLHSMTRLLSAAAEGLPGYEKRIGKLPQRLASLLKEARRNLRHRAP